MAVKINVGDSAKDTITGFTGVVVARTEWLNGCARLTIQPSQLDKDGKPIDTFTFDEMQLEFVSARLVEGPLRADREPFRATGGPRPEPSRASDPQ